MVEEAGRKAVAVAGDIGDEAHCQEIVVQRPWTSSGGIDVLINNAAFQMVQPGASAEITTEQFDRVLKTNLYAMFFLCQGGAAAHGRGRSDHQHHLDPGLSTRAPSLLAYASTKGAIVTFTKGLAARR